MLGRLRDYAYARKVIHLRGITARLLTEWRNGWTFNKESSGPAVAWSMVKSFFRWAHAIDLIPSNESAKLNSLPVVRKQVQPLTRDEMAALLVATSQCGFSPEVEERVRLFILLQRWSGLALLDAATLKRELLRGDDNLTQVHRTKTSTDVFVPLPPAVAKMLRAHPNDNPDYFFWNPDRMTRASLVAQCGDWIRLVFDKARVKHGQQEMLTHRFRHTFAVELLLAGVPMEQVSKLLGHKTVRTTERYYSAWVAERQRKLEAEVKQAWKQMELPALSASHPAAPAPAALDLPEAVIEGMIQ